MTRLVVVQISVFASYTEADATCQLVHVLLLLGLSV